jgi:hypothetical protein
MADLMRGREQQHEGPYTHGHAAAPPHARVPGLLEDAPPEIVPDLLAEVPSPALRDVGLYRRLDQGFDLLGVELRGTPGRVRQGLAESGHVKGLRRVVLSDFEQKHREAAGR